MKILLVDIDSKMPNLALMKLSAWHKVKGDQVFFMESCDPDIVYVSCVFAKNKAKALGVKSMFPNKDVIIGGSGVDLNVKLPDEVEHSMPDYSLYEKDQKLFFGNLANLNVLYDGKTSMGFTSRGCIRNCPFCIVPKKEGLIRDHAPITEFWDKSHDQIILFDNSFLASPKWKENLFFIMEHRLKVNFNQGLDIRLIDEYNAKLLAHTHFYNRTFKFEQLHFAWDLMHPDMEKAVRDGVKHLIDRGISPHNLMFYMLVGFNTTFDQDYYRFKVLRELGVDPFVMIYNNRKDRPILRHFARWVNKRIYKVCADFGVYDPSIGHGYKTNGVERDVC